VQTFTFALNVVLLVSISACYLRKVTKETHGDLLQHIYLLLFGYLGVYGVELYFAQQWMRQEIPEETILLANTLPSLGLVAILAGYRFGLRRFPGLVQRYATREIRLSRIVVYGTLVSLVGIAGELYFIKLSGGVATYFSRARGLGNYEGSTAYISAARWLLTPGIAILIGAATRVRRRSLYGLLGAFWTLAFGYNLVMGQRTGVIVYLVLGLGAYRVLRRTKPGIAALASVLFMALVLAGALDETREDFYLGSNFNKVHALLSRPVNEVLADTISGHFVQTAPGNSERNAQIEAQLYVRYLDILPQQVSYDHGQFYVQYLVAWIPRILWPTRPDYQLEEKNRILDVLGTCHICGPTPSILGMYWMHFGFVSVVLLCFFTGVFYAFFDANGRFQPYRNPITLAIYLSIAGTAAKAAIFLGPLAEFPTWAPYVALPLVILVFVCSKRRPKRGLLVREPALMPAGRFAARA
jgi:hypothetical protein